MGQLAYNQRCATKDSRLHGGALKEASLYPLRPQAWWLLKCLCWPSHTFKVEQVLWCPHVSPCLLLPCPGLAYCPLLHSFIYGLVFWPPKPTVLAHATEQQWGYFDVLGRELISHRSRSQPMREVEDKSLQYFIPWMQGEASGPMLCRGSWSFLGPQGLPVWCGCTHWLSLLPCLMALLALWCFLHLPNKLPELKSLSRGPLLWGPN